MLGRASYAPDVLAGERGRADVASPELPALELTGELPKELPAWRKRWVEIQLPDDLAIAHDEDLVLLYRLSLAACELVGEYVGSSGAVREWQAGPITNVFCGGSLPLPAVTAPALYGRSPHDVYAPSPEPDASAATLRTFLRAREGS